MDDLFRQLETRIQALMEKCERLTVANAHLKHAKSLLSREKEHLLAKNKLAVTHIENMVSRLKTLENAHEHGSS